MQELSSLGRRARSVYTIDYTKHKRKRAAERESKRGGGRNRQLYDDGRQRLFRDSRAFRRRGRKMGGKSDGKGNERLRRETFESRAERLQSFAIESGLFTFVFAIEKSRAFLNNKNKKQFR